MKKRIIIVRHGETDGNIQDRVQTPETPLNSLGEQQIQELAHSLLENNEFVQIISSDHARAIKSAQILSESLNIPHSEINSLLNERNAGLMRDMYHTEIFEKYPEVVSINDKGEKFIDITKRPPEGESWDDLLLRAEKIVEYAQTLDSNTILVAHGGIIRAILSHIHNVPNFEDNYKQFKVDNASFFEL